MSDYLKEIRALIGNRPFIMVGAALLGMNDNGELLLLKRTDNHCWGVPGGAMEPGESIEQTLSREVFEESGFEVKNPELWGIFSGKELFYKYPNGAEVHNVTVVFTEHIDPNQVKINSNEHSEFKFFALSNLPEEISPPIQPILKKLLQKKKK